MSAAHSPSGRISTRQWLGLAALALPTLLISIDMTALSLAVPSLSADLQPTGVELLWITDIYGFVIAAFLVTMGTLGDRIGRRRLLMIGAAAFGVASLLAAFSTTPLMLILTRALLGLAGATLMPSTLALLRDLFADPAQRTFAISVWMTSFLAGTALGPLTGGLLLEFFWWGSVFLLAVPVMVLLLVAGPFVLPKNATSTSGRLDLPSVGQAAAAIILLVFGIKQVISGGRPDTVVAAVALGAVSAVLFVRRQNRLADPLLDLRLFRSRVFSTAMGLQTVGVFATVAVQFLLAQYLQLVLDLSPLVAGLWTLPGAVAGVVGALSVARLVAGIRPARVFAVGLSIVVAGLALVAWGTAVASLGVIVVGSVLMGLGFAPVMALAAVLVVSSVPAERAGAASAVSETAGELGVSLGIAVLGSVALGVYRTGVGPLLPPGLPHAVVDSATNTIGGAAAAAYRLPPGLGDAVLTATTRAFTTAQVTVAVVAAVILLALVVAVLSLLKDLPAGATEE